MARRKKADPPKPPTLSDDWREYKPWEPRYWRFGGPYIEPEAIEPQARNPSEIGGAMKPVGRRKWAIQCKADAEASLKQRFAYYVSVKKHGMNGISPYLRDDWQARVHSCSVKPEDPDPVSEQLAFAYRDIRWGKGTLAACDAAIFEVDRVNEPLLRGLD
jgi:hypothetical protein